MDLSRFKAFINKEHFNKGMRGMFFDEMHQKVVATDGHMMLVLNAQVNETKIVDLKGEQIFEPFPFWKGVFPTYNKGVQIDVKDLITKLSPFAKLCKKDNIEKIGLDIDGDIIYFNSKMLFQGLKSLQTNTATLYYDGVLRGITFRTDVADLLIMPIYTESANVVEKYQTSSMIFTPFDQSDKLHFYHAFGRGLNYTLTKYETGEINMKTAIKETDGHLPEIYGLIYDHRYAPYLEKLLNRCLL